MEIFTVITMWVHSMLNKPQQLSCKATLLFLTALVILTEGRYFQEVRERGFVGNCFVHNNIIVCVSVMVKFYNRL